MMEITNEDNMELMARYPDKHFDLAIVDPPYGIGGDKGIQKNNGKFGFKEHRKTNWDNAIPSSEYFSELLRVSKNQIVWGGNYFTQYLKPKMCWLSWDKEQTNFSFSDFELAWTSFDTKCKVFRLIRGFDKRGEHYSSNLGRIHPTQKPTALYEWILVNYAKPNQKILDTHLGSGSIAIAIDKVNKIEGMNLTLTACELDKEYYDAAMKRIEQHTRQTTIF